MILTSWPFAAFVVGTLVLYVLLPRRGQLALLLVASYAFYASWSWHFPMVLLAVTAGNHWIGGRLWRRPGRGWLAAGISLNVALLLVLKYSGFYLAEALTRLGAPPDGRLAEFLGLLLPVGFSYRMLENVSFLVDSSRRQLDRYPAWLDYALYVAYFPKLLSGPIERGRAFLSQLAGGRALDDERLARAATLIAVGAFRKLVLADGIRGLMPRGLFVSPWEDPGLQIAVWLLADVFVIYNDFAGYTSMVRGVSALFGIELSRNFSAPFFSRNFSELWMRWHMSLSLWLRDYVYMPASRALLRRSDRANRLPNLLVPPLAAMLVSALWHGISWNLLAWGVAWGLFLILARLPSLWGTVVPPDRRPVRRQVLGMVSVAAMLAASTVLFQADLSVALPLAAAVIAPGTITWPLVVACAWMVLSLSIDRVQHRSQDETVFLRWPLWARSGALALAIASIFLATRFDVPEPFIYQNF